MNGKNNIGGFTLLELIVSIGAIALMSVILSQVFFSALRTNTKTEILKEVKQNGDVAQEIMVRFVQNAQYVTSACESTGTVSKDLTILNSDNGSTTFGCVEDSGIFRIASQSASGIDYLTSNNVTLGGSACANSTISFTCTGGTGVPSTVTMSFELSQSGTTVNSFEEFSSGFQTSVTTRNVMH